MEQNTLSKRLGEVVWLATEESKAVPVDPLLYYGFGVPGVRQESRAPFATRKNREGKLRVH